VWVIQCISENLLYLSVCPSVCLSESVLSFSRYRAFLDGIDLMVGHCENVDEILPHNCNINTVMINQSINQCYFHSSLGVTLLSFNKHPNNQSINQCYFQSSINESTDASHILFEPPSEIWKKPRGRPRNSWVWTVTNDLANSYTGLLEAREAAQDRVYWRMFTKHSATHS